MSFNSRFISKQELLSKEDIELLLQAIDGARMHGELNSTSDRIEFLIAKLKRMKK